MMDRRVAHRMMHYMVATTFFVVHGMMNLCHRKSGHRQK
jgi:hypothetical protein